MSFTAAPPLPAPKPSGTGVSVALFHSKRGGYVRFTITEDAQRRFFGDVIYSRSCAVQIGRGSDEGKVMINLVENGPFAFSDRGIKGSCSVKVGVWDLLPKDKRPAAACEVVHFTDATLTLKLPSWARPSSHDGKIASEHGLKPIQRHK